MSLCPALESAFSYLSPGEDFSGFQDFSPGFLLGISSVIFQKDFWNPRFWKIISPEKMFWIKNIREDLLRRIVPKFDRGISP